MCLVVSDQEQAALLLTIEGVHRRKQALAFDQPGPVIFIHIQDEDEIFGCQIPSDRGKVPDTTAKNLLPGKLII
jgi:hypothetical protein